MIQLDLSNEEKNILIETLQSDFSDLAMEISNTDLLDYREVLKERKRVLGEVIEKLETSH